MARGGGVKGRLPTRQLLGFRVQTAGGNSPAMGLPSFHPHYRDLHAELLARPFPVVAAPVMVSHRAILRGAAHEEGHRRAVAEARVLAGAAGILADSPDFQLLRLGQVDLRIEWHHEFTSFTLIAPVGAQPGAAPPFAALAHDLLPAGWLEVIPGELIASVEMASEHVSLSRAGTPEEMERIAGLFAGGRLVGGWVIDRVASVWSHFRLDAAGASRFLIQDHRLTPGRFGRLIQRLLEIETYRLMALLGLPLAREYLPKIEELERSHADLVERLGVAPGAGADEQTLLADLTSLAVQAERLQARGESRFAVTAAYARILSDRVRELREVQVPGYQTIGEFFDRRMTMALTTCGAAHARLQELTGRIHSSTGLLRTRVEVNLQNQNQHLLASVDRRSATQLQLQHAVEGLSVVILTYYLVGLLQHLVEATKVTGLHLDAELLSGLAVVPVGVAVWWSVRRVHHAHRH